MSNENLTAKQRYLRFILPSLNDLQIDRMVASLHREDEKTGIEAIAAQGAREPYDRLMSMVGCAEAKRQVTAMIADHRMRKIIEGRGRSTTRAYYHAVFTGNPGCAKTTVARLCAAIFAAEGIIEKGTYEEVTRADLVGEYVGSTTKKVREVFERNRGGLIFVDEAYALNDGNPSSNNNYGIEAINEILVDLESQPETVVIFAGYPDRMEEFLAVNPGLKSRVPYVVHFANYTTEELIEITRQLAVEKGFKLTDTAVEKLRVVYDTAKTDPLFGNGRFVRNQIESAVRMKAMKLGIVSAKTLSEYDDRERFPDDVLFTLDADCFVIPVRSAKPVHKMIGFKANKSY